MRCRQSGSNRTRRSENYGPAQHVQHSRIVMDTEYRSQATVQALASRHYEPSRAAKMSWTVERLAMSTPTWYQLILPSF